MSQMHKSISRRDTLDVRTGGMTVLTATLLALLVSLFAVPALAGPIHEAAKADDAAQVERLLATGIDVDERDVAKKTALHWAAEAGHIKVARLLVANGADVNAKDFANYTALHAASYHEHEAVAELLIASGADVNALDKVGISPLDRPANKGFPGIIAMLQSAGAECGTNDYESKACKQHLGLE